MCVVVTQLNGTAMTCGVSGTSARYESKEVCESYVQHTDMKEVFKSFYDALHQHNIDYPDKPIGLEPDAVLKYTHTCEEVNE